MVTTSVALLNRIMTQSLKLTGKTGSLTTTQFVCDYCFMSSQLSLAFLKGDSCPQAILRILVNTEITGHLKSTVGPRLCLVSNVRSETISLGLGLADRGLNRGPLVAAYHLFEVSLI